MSTNSTVIFDPKARSYEGCQSKGESTYQYLDRLGVAGDAVRRTANHMFLRLPESLFKTALLPRLQSTDANVFDEAFFQLFAHDYLSSRGNEVICLEGMPLAGDSRTPRFLCQSEHGQFYAAVATTERPTNSQIALKYLEVKTRGYARTGYGATLTVAEKSDELPLGMTGLFVSLRRALAVNTGRRVFRFEYQCPGWHLKFRCERLDAERTGFLTAESAMAIYQPLRQLLVDAVAKETAGYGVLTEPLVVLINAQGYRRRYALEHCADAMYPDYVDQVGASVSELFGELNKLACSPFDNFSALSGMSKAMEAVILFEGLQPFNVDHCPRFRIAVRQGNRDVGQGTAAASV